MVLPLHANVSGYPPHDYFTHTNLCVHYALCMAATIRGEMGHLGQDIMALVVLDYYHNRLLSRLQYYPVIHF
jgi:hypothetical protein